MVPKKSRFSPNGLNFAFGMLSSGMSPILNPVLVRLHYHHPAQVLTFLNNLFSTFSFTSLSRLCLDSYYQHYNQYCYHPTCFTISLSSSYNTLHSCTSPQKLPPASSAPPPFIDQVRQACDFWDTAYTSENWKHCTYTYTESCSTLIACKDIRQKK